MKSSDECPEPIRQSQGHWKGSTREKNGSGRIGQLALAPTTRCSPLRRKMDSSWMGHLRIPVERSHSRAVVIRQYHNVIPLRCIVRLRLENNRLTGH